MRVCPPAPQVQGLEAKVEQLSASLAEMGGGSGPGHIGKAIARSMGKRAVQPATLVTALLTIAILAMAKCTRSAHFLRGVSPCTPHPAPRTPHPSPLTPHPSPFDSALTHRPWPSPVEAARSDDRSWQGRQESVATEQVTAALAAVVVMLRMATLILTLTPTPTLAPIVTFHLTLTPTPTPTPTQTQTQTQKP